MKILFVLSTLQMGGAEKVAVELANRWAEEHEVSLLTLDVGNDFFKLSPLVERYALNILRKSYKNPIPHIKMILGIKKVARKIRPDYIISFVGKTNVFVLLALNSKKYKIIACEHSTIRRDKDDRLVDFFRHRLYPKAHRITVLSSFIKEDFVEKYKKVASSRVVITPNALDIKKIDEMPTKEDDVMIKEMDELIKKGGKIVVSLGRFAPVKRFSLLIKMFSHFYKEYTKEGKEVFLFIFGGGDEREAYLSLVLELGMEGHIFIKDRVHNVFSVLKRASLYACTSKFEGFGMSIIEAFYSKVPVISFDVQGIDELLEDNKTALLVKEGDEEGYASSLHRILEDDFLRNTLIANAFQKSFEYTPEKIDDIWKSQLLV